MSISVLRKQKSKIFPIEGKYCISSNTQDGYPKNTYDGCTDNKIFFTTKKNPNFIFYKTQKKRLLAFYLGVQYLKIVLFCTRNAIGPRFPLSLEMKHLNVLHLMVYRCRCKHFVMNRITKSLNMPIQTKRYNFDLIIKKTLST